MTNETLTQRIRDEFEDLRCCYGDREELGRKASFTLGLGSILANSALCFYRGLTNQPIVDGNSGAQLALVGTSLIGANINAYDRTDENCAAIVGSMVYPAIAYGLGKFLGGMTQ